MKTQHTNRQLRSFGLTVGGMFLLIAIWPALRHGRDFHVWAFVLSGALLLPGIAMPAALARPYQLWMGLAHVLGWINTKIILTIMYYAVFTPVAIITRWMGKDPMNRKFVSDADTYRVLREPRNASHMKHQF